MGRSPCCDERGLKKGPWTPEEDQKLVDYIQKNGHGSWRALPKLAGLNRCGKSCRLRWSNYLRPDIKRGNFSYNEEQTILDLHSILGNKWSTMATHLPGRTDNEIKNHWNTHLKKKLLRMGIDPVTHKPRMDLNMLLSDPSLRLQADAAQLAGLYLQNLLHSMITTAKTYSLPSANERPMLPNYQLENQSSYPDIPIEPLPMNSSLCDLTNTLQIPSIYQQNKQLPSFVTPGSSSSSPSYANLSQIQDQFSQHDEISTSSSMTTPAGFEPLDGASLEAQEWAPSEINLDDQIRDYWEDILNQIASTSTHIS